MRESLLHGAAGEAAQQEPPGADKVGVAVNLNLKVPEEEEGRHQWRGWRGWGARAEARARECFHWLRRTPIAYGQVLSLAVAGTGVCTTILQAQQHGGHGRSVPTFQNLGNYLLLSLYTLRLPARAELVPGWWWKYPLLALFDLEGNFLIVKAYEYTTITSIMLLDCFTIPSAMLLSYVILRARYRTLHFVGMIICLLGLAVNVVADLRLHKSGSDDGDDEDDDDAQHSSRQRAIGDLLTIGATLCYAVTNVMQEKFVKDDRREEWLAMVGVFGLCFASIQASALEYHEIAKIQWTIPVVLALVGYSLCLFSLYANLSIFFEVSDAAMYNLSLLTSDVWAVLAAAFLFRQHITWLYFVAFGIVVIGVCVYSKPPAPSPAPSAIAATTTAAAAAAEAAEAAPTTTTTSTT